MSQNFKTARSGKNWVNSANLLFSLEYLNSKPNFSLLYLVWVKVTLDRLDFHGVRLG
jgi:hypothetical protein